MIEIDMNIEKPKVTKPWSKEMYEWNDYVATLMKGEIKVQIENNKDDWDTLNKLMVLCGGVRYGHGFTTKDLYEGCLDEVEMAPNYWLNDEWDYAVKEGVVNDCVKIKFVGY